MNISRLEKAGILRKVRLEKKVNSHSACRIEMLYTGDNISELQGYIGTEIVVENNERKLMRGYIDSIELNNAFSKSTVIFNAVSLSAKTDESVHNRVYQSTKKKYSDIISCLKNDKADFRIIEKSFADEKSEKLVIQKNETDFSFAKRLASSRELYLLIDDTSEKCSVNIAACGNGAKKILSEEQIIYLDYSVTRYEEQYTVTSREYLEFGSKVTLNGYDYTIIGFTLYFENNEEIYQYVFSRITENKQETAGNSSVILGKCRITNNKDPENKGRLQVAFLEYEDSIPDNALWIPYINNMTEGEFGTMYIPDAEEIVSVYYCNSDCYACGCVRDKAYNSKMNDVAVRSVFTRNIKADISDKGIYVDAFDYKVRIEKDNAIIENSKNSIRITDSEITIKNNSSVIQTEKDTVKMITDNKLQLKTGEINAEGQSKVTIKTPALDIG